MKRTGIEASTNLGTPSNRVLADADPIFKLVIESADIDEQLLVFFFVLLGLVSDWFEYCRVVVINSEERLYRIPKLARSELDVVGEAGEFFACGYCGCGDRFFFFPCRRGGRSLRHAGFAILWVLDGGRRSSCVMLALCGRARVVSEAIQRTNAVF